MRSWASEMTSRSRTGTGTTNAWYLNQIETSLAMRFIEEFLDSLLSAATYAATTGTCQTSKFAVSVETTGTTELAALSTDFSVEVTAVLLLVSCCSSHAASFSSSHAKTPY